MNKKFFTVEDLIKFCEAKKIYNFSSKESNEPIVVQSIQDFSKAEIEESDDGKLYAKVRVCHTLLNRNNSYISEESMLEAMPTLKYSPLLASIHQLDDGTWDFHSHDFHIEEDEDGNEYEVYDENQVGTFTADDPYLEYDKVKNKTYVVAKVAIPIEYTRTADIIKSKGGTKVSCELLIYDCSYNAEKHYLQLDHFRFNGCTCLGSEKDGTPIGEGMEGSFLSLEDFSVENNSLLKYVDEKLNAMQSSIDELDARFNIEKEKTMKGGTELNKKHFEEEFTEPEEVTETEESKEEVTTTEEESEETVEETSEEETKTTEEVEETQEVAEEETEDTTASESETESFSKDELFNKLFDISFEDIRYALNALCSIYRNDSEWCYVSQVYDEYFIMQDWDSDKYYKQSYTRDEDNIALAGERTEMFAMLLTESEKISIEEMRSNYAELKAFKEEIELNELREKKKAILDSEKYEILAQKDNEGKFVNKDYEKLVSEMDNYSLADLETEIKVLHSDYVSEHGNFALSNNKEEKPVTSKKQFVNVNKKPSKPSRYGKLFAEEEK